MSGERGRGRAKEAESGTDPLDRLLALETAGPVASVAVARRGKVVARHFLDEPRSHAAGILPAVEHVLDTADIGREELSAVAVGSGPGSFTGVRVAAATAKGIAHALAIPIFAVSSLLGAAFTEEAAEAQPGQGIGPSSTGGGGGAIGLRVVLFDARGDRLYMAAYRLGRSVPGIVIEPRFATLDEVLDEPRLQGAAFCGDGAVRHARALAQIGGSVLSPPIGFPSADGIVEALARMPAPTPVEDPWEWEPDYLRETGAIRSRRSRTG
ncbi:MAG: tRNA (adenosine(37)-N6)-threonylcarbamoyltransferase complex dimerization subunit type 1 TsaB [Longimicrobiales bacterium]|nr:tRNA (adenosine(37)-N6)-threonylcarbamoyltransferase complex dimerization subunit type 1 TsaB [Longimicrobiales bacterium]